MRALLVVNPVATATTVRVREVLTGAMASEVKIESEITRCRGHAAEAARRAVADGLDAVIVLGGDGTVNEVVNGLLAEGPSAHLPALAVVPAGSTNVFARALGLPNDPVEATAVLLEAVRLGRRRVIGLGRADDRYFTFCAGLGLDAEVVRLIERQRAGGGRATPTRYLRTAVRHFFLGTDRRRAPLTLHLPDGPCDSRLFLAIVTNCTPWTYLGGRPVQPCPRARFEAGIDLFAARRLGTVTTARHVQRMLFGGTPGTGGRDIVALHDEETFTLVADRPVALEVDGDYAGECERVKFSAMRRALSVIA